MLDYGTQLTIDEALGVEAPTSVEAPEPGGLLEAYTLPPTCDIVVAAWALASPTNLAGQYMLNETRLRSKTGYSDRTLQLAWKHLVDANVCTVSRLSGSIRLVRVITDTEPARRYWHAVEALAALWA